MLADSEVNVSR